MIHIAKYDFPQETPPHPFKTIKLAELSNALFVKRLHGRGSKTPSPRKVREFISGRFVWARPVSHRIIRTAKQWSETQILIDLRAEALTAYVPAVTGGVFYKIEREFWDYKFAGLSVAGRLFHLDADRAVPHELLGKTIYVLERSARAWLADREIDGDNPAFPKALRLFPHKPKPPDVKIRAQLKRMKSAGLSRDQAAKQISKVPGFENVGNEEARNIISGHLPRGRPRKATRQK